MLLREKSINIISVVNKNTPRNNFISPRLETIETEMPKSLKTIIIPGVQADSILSPFAFHPIGDWLVTTSPTDRNAIIQIGCENGAIRTLCNLSWHPESLCFAPSGQFLAAVGDENICLIEFTGESQSRLVFETEHKAELPEDDEIPIVFTDNGAFWVFFHDRWEHWSANEPNKRLTFNGATTEPLLRACRQTNGEVVAVTYDEEMYNHKEITLSKINLSTQDVETTIPLSEWAFTLVSSDARLVLVQRESSNSLVDLFNLETGKRLVSFKQMSLHYHPQFFSDNQYVVTHPCEDASWTSLVVTDVRSGIVQQFDTLSPFRPRVCASHHHNLFATIANAWRHPVDRTCFWDSSGTLLGESCGHVGYGNFSVNVNWFATISSSANEEDSVGSQLGGTIRITDLRDIA